MELQLRFVDGKLLASRESSNRHDVVTTVVGTLGAMWRFQKWTESRWLTVGTSARTVAAAFLTGLDSMVEYFKKGSACEESFLCGFVRMIEDRRAFLVEAAVVSRVCKGVLTELMEGHRVAMRHMELWQAAADEMQWVTLLDEFV